MNFGKITVAVCGLFVVGGVLAAQPRMSREEYIRRYKELVLESQEVYGIPASVKMAQALLESDSGNSRLAREANNHFGIKCKRDWTGMTISHDDDAKGECFRKYASAEESFRDHSEFLDNSPRYQELFKLDPLDYKGWAYGLKAAGYATDPNYPQRLIRIIEENRLYLLDQHKELPEELPRRHEPVGEQLPEPVVSAAEKIDVDNYIVSVQKLRGYALYHNNGSQFIVADNGDTFESLGRKIGISAKRLRKLNDLPANAQLSGGEMVYVRSKAKRSGNGKLIHIVREGDTMHSISQQYGIRLKNLANMNHRDVDARLEVGQQIRLM